MSSTIADLRERNELAETPSYNKQAVKDLFVDGRIPTHTEVLVAKSQGRPVGYDSASGTLLNKAPGTLLKKAKTMFSIGYNGADDEEKEIKKRRGRTGDKLGLEADSHVRVDLGENEGKLIKENQIYSIEKAKEWSPYLGLDVDSVTRAIFGFEVNIFITANGGSLWTIQMRHDFDSGKYLMRRAQDEVSYLYMKDLISILRNPFSCEYFAKIKRSERPNSAVKYTLLNTWHCIAEFYVGDTGVCRGRKRRLYFFSFLTEGELNLFCFMASCYRSHLGLPQFDVRPDPNPLRNLKSVTSLRREVKPIF